MSDDKKNDPELPNWDEKDPANAPFRNYRKAMGGSKRIAWKIPGSLKNEIRVPIDPYEWWCKPGGDVVALTVMTNRNFRHEAARDMSRYGSYLRNDCIKKGWFPWQYAFAATHTPWILQQNGIDSEEQWKEWRLKEQDRRKEQKALIDNEYNKAYAAEQERDMMRSEAAMSRALERFTNLLAETTTKKRGLFGKGD